MSRQKLTKNQSVSQRFVDFIHIWPILLKYKFFKRKGNLIQVTVQEKTIIDKNNHE